MLEFKKISPAKVYEKKLLNDVRIFLHDCYVKDLKWNIDKNNPSGIKTIKSANKEMLIDDYDLFSEWFVELLDKKIIGCARLIKQDNNGLLEIERYKSSEASISTVLTRAKETNIIELNREVISNRYHNKRYYLLLLKKIFEYSVLQGFSIITTTNLIGWKTIYQLIQFPKVQNAGFKYWERDPDPVDVYFADKNAIEAMLINIDNYLLRRVSHDYKTLSLSFA